MSDVAVGLELAGTEGQPPLLLIHGFAGSARTWDFVLPHLEPHYRVVLLELPGHGAAAVQHGVDLARIADTIAHLLREGVPEPRFVCGYSMGGRIALQAALRHPGVITKLALIGTSPGIEDIAERTARVESDNRLAVDIRARGLKWFEDHWSGLPMFATQHGLPPETREWLRRERLANDPEGLALALEQWGTGRQEWLLPQLAGLSCPALLLNGARDEKFSRLSRQMAAAIPAVRHIEIPDAGHAAHIEQPEATAWALIQFFQ